MKYVITMVDGEYQAPVLLKDWIASNFPEYSNRPDVLEFLTGMKPTQTNSGIHFLIDLPA